MDRDCRDLIDRLVRLEPAERLGAGGSGGGMDKLMSHPYFEGIEWEKLHLTKVPISEHFLHELRLREEEEEKELKKNAGFGGGSIYLSDGEEDKEVDPDSIIKQGRPAGRPPPLTPQHPHPSPPLSGIVIKKCGWFLWRKRLLRLTEKPSITYYDPVKNELKVGLLAAHFARTRSR